MKIHRSFTSETRYFTKHGSWNMASNIAALGINIALSMTLAARLPQETFGLYKAVYSLIGILGIFTLSGVQNALLYSTAKTGGNFLPRASRLYLKSAWPFGIALAAYATYTAYAGYGMAFTMTLILAGVGSVATTASGMYGYFLAGQQRFKEASAAAFTISLLQAMCTTGMLMLTKGLLPVVITHTFSGTALTAYYYWKISKEQSFESEAKNELMPSSVHFTGTNIISTIGNYGDKIIIFHVLGARQLALYGLADDMVAAGKGLIKSCMGIYSSRIARASYPRIMRSLPQDIAIALGSGLILYLIYFVTTPYIFSYFYGGYTAATEYVRLLAGILIFIIPITYIAQVFQSKNMLKSMYTSTTLTHITRIAAYSFGAYYAGITGILLSQVATYAASLVLSIVLLKTASKEKFKDYSAI
jgi:O-antigen/teichoic acid export membrane protein